MSNAEQLPKFSSQIQAGGGSDHNWAHQKVMELKGGSGGKSIPALNEPIFGAEPGHLSEYTLRGKSTEQSHSIANEMQPEVTKALLDARLEAAEARMDVRMVSIDAKFDALQKAILQQGEDLKSFKTDVQAGLADFKKEVHQDNKSTRTTIFTTGVAAVLSIVLGVAAFNATVLSNMVASFESGRNTAQALSDAATKIENAQAAKNEAKPPIQAPQAK